MKYKYEFEVDDSFEKGCCHECLLSYVDYDKDYDDCCILHARYDECPLELVVEK